MLDLVRHNRQQRATCSARPCSRSIVAVSAACALLGISLWLTTQSAGQSPANAPQVAVLELDGTVQPASLRYLERGLDRAADMGAELVVIELNTPGGLLVSLRSMTTAIGRSEVPVAVYVTPAGAQAASAGFFLLMAADIAAMAPGTNAGAASPVILQRDQQTAEDKTLLKATEDAAALVRSLAAARERSVEWAEKAVREARSYSAREAREHRLIEAVAARRSELLEKLEGRVIRRLDGTTSRLHMAGAKIVKVEPTFAEQFLMVVAHPQVAYLLLMLGFLGLMLELMSPGIGVPGVLGGISLLVAMYALSILPVNWVGVLLIAAGIGLLIAEAFVTSYGLLAVGGLVSLIFGSLMLLDTPVPSWRINLELIIPSILVLAATSLFLLSRALRFRRRPSMTGLEAMVGEVGELLEAIDRSQGEGRVFVHGEYWAATAEEPISGGARVRIEQIEGHRLHVVPVESQST